MKVKFLKDISTPAAQQGRAGEVKELPDRLAKNLIKGGYVSDDLEAQTTEETAHAKQAVLCDEMTKMDEFRKENKRKQTAAARKALEEKHKSENQKDKKKTHSRVNKNNNKEINDVE